MHVPKWLPEHIVTTTAQVTVLTPTYTFLEHIVSSMSKGETQISRRTGMTLMFLGLGKLVDIGRDYYLKRAQVDTNSPASLRRMYDKRYGIIFNGAVSVPWYLAVGVDDWLKVTLATVSTMAFGYIIQGELLGKATDISKDITGIRESPQTPQFIKNLTSTQKALVPVVAGAGAIALTELLWRLPTMVDMYTQLMQYVK